MTVGSLVLNTALKMGESSAYKVSKKEDGSTVVLYDNPYCIDEECTYTINKDGSAKSVSHAWGEKKSLPAGTFKEEEMNKSGKEIVDLFHSYLAHPRKLDVQA